jgi:methylglutaconyl-CoA hydratase
MADDPAVRVLVISSTGKSFCAGADLNWMKRPPARRARQRTCAIARSWPACCGAWPQCPKPTIARVQGPAYGGGVGLVACCDIASPPSTRSSR